MIENKVDILLIDDTPSNLFALEVILEDPGYNLITASSARQALNYLAKHDVALILTDVMMPIMDGFEFAERMKQEDRLASIPIIFLTAMAKDVDQVFKGYTCGAVDYIQKPLTEEIVRTKVEVFAQLYRQKLALRKAQDELLRLNKGLRETVNEQSQALNETESRLQLAAEGASLGMWDFYPPTERLEASEHCKKLLKVMSDEELSFRSFLACVHADERDKVCDYMLHPLAKEIEFRIVSQQEIRWIRSTGQAFFDSDEKPLRFIGMLQDITERKLAELTLHEQAQLLELASESIMVRDASDKLIYWNRSAEDLYGWSKEEALGAKLHVLLETEFPFPLEDIMAKLLEQGRWAGELVHRKRNGETLVVSSRWALQRSADGAVYKILETNSDITQKKHFETDLQVAKENAEAANRAKTEFLANMSHEIRTPLGAILGFSELLREPNLSQTEKLDFIDTINRNGSQLSQLIDEILDLSKIEAGRLETERVELSLNHLLADVMSSLSVKAREKAIDLLVEPQGEIPEYITSDPTRLRQILFNIVGNAIKFTQKGFVKVMVCLEKPLAAGRHTLVFRIADTGIGIEAESQKKLFRTFAQADASTTRKFGGTGLGLVLSQRLAHALGGDLVLLQSSKGKGSIFCISIDPGEMRNFRSGLESRESPSLAPKLSSMALNGVHVLLAEDQLDNQFLITRILTKNGASVDLVENGMEAVKKAMSEHYDIVLMDMQMPIQDGYDSTRELRLSGYKKPIIALTAHALREEREKSLKAGCNDHLPKPISHQALIAMLRQYSSAEQAH